MGKAYDLYELGMRLKQKGLMSAEVAVEDALTEVFNWLEESAKLSATTYDDLGLIVLPKIKSLIFPLVDKIDGKEG